MPVDDPLAAATRAEEHRRRWIGGLIPFVAIVAAIVLAVVLGTPGWWPSWAPQGREGSRYSLPCLSWLSSQCSFSWRLHGNSAPGQLRLNCEQSCRHVPSLSTTIKSVETAKYSSHVQRG
jgi:hypothetical protein